MWHLLFKSSFPDDLKYYFSLSQTYFHVKCCLSIWIYAPCKGGMFAVTPFILAVLRQQLFCFSGSDFDIGID